MTTFKSLTGYRSATFDPVSQLIVAPSTVDLDVVVQALNAEHGIEGATIDGANVARVTTPAGCYVIAPFVTRCGCAECDFRGWAIFNVPFTNKAGDDTGGDVQRCDSCATLACDGSAIELASNLGYVVDRESGVIRKMPRGR